MMRDMRTDFQDKYPTPEGATYSIFQGMYIGSDKVNITLLTVHNIRWETWKASRATLSVDFPKIDEPTIYEQAVLNKCRAVIEAAGVKVKP